MDFHGLFVEIKRIENLEILADILLPKFMEFPIILWKIHVKIMCVFTKLL